ncbi:uncharacterized protein LOC121859856 [Homarus americanus]|uniref:uncharacterized protein LOC121859856 n=1 Tax=Homarus americanus TaxID=6706 RepID=UPI001C47DB63|nr:uncharacterized protein LOC121859856 [Homarus americanus]
MAEEGINDWKNASHFLSTHESSIEHNKTWKELEVNNARGRTIDRREMEKLMAEWNRWRQVLIRLVALRGSTEKLKCPSNGNFLQEVELLAKFDPFMKNHLSRVESNAGNHSHTHYLGQMIQNELINIISVKITERIVDDIKASKYFSIILDCTPDLSHKEQLSLIIRIVALEDKSTIKEHFLGFLEVEKSSGLNLSCLLLGRLKQLNISFEDCRGQSYDNGANMRGTSKEFKPGFFNRILGPYLSHVRWESRVKSVEAIKYQPAQIREALLEFRESATDPVVKVEAQSLAEEVGSYRFVICPVVWYDILSKIQHVSKLMQSTTMQLGVAVDLLKKTRDNIVSYRNTGFAEALTIAKEICEAMNVDTVLKQKRLRTKKCHFSYESADEHVSDALKRMETTFFNVVVDTAISSLNERFKTLGEVSEKFKVLLGFTDMSDKDIVDHCQTLSNTLTHEGHSDIDGRELAMELQSVPDLPSKRMTTMDFLTFLHEKKLTEVFPNLWVALRICATLPVTV